MVLPAAALPWLRTVALRVKVAPVSGLLELTIGASTTRSGAGAAPTVTATATEQLFVVADSSDTASTQAP